MLFWLLVIVLLLGVGGSYPGFAHSREWGYRPMSLVAAVLVILLICWMFGWLPAFIYPVTPVSPTIP